jgi:general secretion pathway protein E
VEATELERMGFPVTEKGEVELKRGKGCNHCRGTGYFGRSAIFEIFPMSEQLRKQVMAKKNADELRQIAIREGMTTLREDAWSKVKQGITSLEEALRVTGEI